MLDNVCYSQRRYFSDHLDGQKLPFWRSLMVRCHLTICARCIRYQRSLTAAREALRALRDPDPR